MILNVCGWTESKNILEDGIAIQVMFFKKWNIINIQDTQLLSVQIDVFYHCIHLCNHT